MMLDIPTYKNFREVMFYDVLQQICNQMVKLYHNKDRINENKAALKVIRLLKQSSGYDDTLQALNIQNLKSDYDIEFDELLQGFN